MIANTHQNQLKSQLIISPIYHHGQQISVMGQVMTTPNFPKSVKAGSLTLYTS